MLESVQDILLVVLLDRVPINLLSVGIWIDQVALHRAPQLSLSSFLVNDPHVDVHQIVEVQESVCGVTLSRYALLLFQLQDLYCTAMKLIQQFLEHRFWTNEFGITLLFS